MDWTHELQEAIAAAEIAGRFVMDEYAKFVPIPNAPASISTHVDRGAQELILKHLREKYPADSLLAEEATPTVQDAPKNCSRVWIVDPIDGTRGFAMKNGEFSVMIALVVDHRPVVGVVLEPVIGRLTYASQGEGCFTRTNDAPPTRCSVSSIETPEAAAIVLSHRKPGKPMKGAPALVKAGRIVETYSAGIKLGMVARGEVELYVNEYEGFHDWDIAPGHVLVEEAGGMVSEFDGQPVRYVLPEKPVRKGMIGSNGKIHAEVLKRLQTM
jgi:3'(2'), 5'-bisphosphate nucleotidase